MTITIGKEFVMPGLTRHPWIADQARNDNEGRATTPDSIRGRNDRSI
jgi:hypothetical protein